MTSSARNHDLTETQNGLRGPRSFPLRWALVGLLLTFIFWFYLWTATQGLPIPWQSDSPDLYNLLTDAFLSGQLSLPQRPSADLLALADPYDPEQNALYRLHDASLYRGKYYLYFGVTPVFFLFLPFRFLSLGSLPVSVAAPLFFFGGLLAALAVLKTLLTRYFPSTPFTFLLFSILALALSDALPFALRRPEVYEVAIACGYFCFMVSFYFLLSWHVLNPRSTLRLSLGSLFLGLAIAARPSWILGSPVLVLASFLVLREKGRSTLRESLPSLLAIWVPFLLILLGIGLYNYLRFDSWLEFGMSYQLAGFHPQKIGQFQRSSLGPGLYFYIWQPLHNTLAFPFFHTHPSYPGSLPTEYIGLEPVAGLLALAPLVWILLLALPLRFLDFIQEVLGHGSKRVGWNGFPWILLLMGIGLLQILLLSFKPGATMRYVADFAPLFILAASFMWVTLYQKWAGRPWVRKFVTFFGILTILYGCTANGAISLTGYFDSFRKSNPKGYQASKEFIQAPVLRIVSKAIRDDLTLLEINNPYGREKLDGMTFFWLGPPGIQVEIFSKKEALIGLWAEMLPGPALPQTPQRRLSVQTNHGYLSREHIFAAGDKAIPIPVHRGVNRIGIYPLDQPSAQVPGDPRIFLLRLSNVRVKDLTPPAIIGVENQNGLEKAPEGIPFFWMGQGETVITVFSSRKGPLLLSGEFHPGPSLPETPVRRLLLRTDQGFEKRVPLNGAGEQVLSFPAERGSNWIFLACLDSPTHRLENDPRPLLLMVRGLRLKEPP